MSSGRHKKRVKEKRGLFPTRRSALALTLLPLLVGIAVSLLYLYPDETSKVKSPENTFSVQQENEKKLVASLKEEESAGRILDSESIKGKICLVLDDVGYEKERAEHFINEGIPVTVAILPGGNYSRRIAKLAKRNGLAVLLHMPMAPEKKVSDMSDKYILSVGMSEKLIASRLNRARAWVPGMVGISNHMGSRFTSDPGGMKIVAAYLKKQGLYFLDSRTTPRSVAAFVCRVTGVPYLERDVFIDNDHDAQKIREQFERLKNIASGRGYSIGILHPGKIVTGMIGELMRSALLQGYRFVTLNEIIEEM